MYNKKPLLCLLLCFLLILSACSQGGFVAPDGAPNDGPTPSIDLSPSPTPTEITPLSPLPSPVPTSVLEDETAQAWGLGEHVSRYVSASRPYEWYIDQGTTGEFYLSNCGPSCAVMAATWYDASFSQTVESIRAAHYSTDDGWYFREIAEYLTDIEIPSVHQRNISAEALVSELDAGHIMLMGVETQYLTHEDDGVRRLGRYDPGDFRHCILIKGYAVVDGQTYFEIYDPNSIDRRYDDGTLKGKDRYYLAEELITAVSNYTNDYIVVYNDAADLAALDAAA